MTPEKFQELIELAKKLMHGKLRGSYLKQSDDYQAGLKQWNLHFATLYDLDPNQAMLLLTGVRQELGQPKTQREALFRSLFNSFLPQRFTDNSELNHYEEFIRLAKTKPDESEDKTQYAIAMYCFALLFKVQKDSLVKKPNKYLTNLFLYKARRHGDFLDPNPNEYYSASLHSLVDDIWEELVVDPAPSEPLSKDDQAILERSKRHLFSIEPEVIFDKIKTITDVNTLTKILTHGHPIYQCLKRDGFRENYLARAIDHLAEIAHQERVEKGFLLGVMSRDRGVPGEISKKIIEFVGDDSISRGTYEYTKYSIQDRKQRRKLIDLILKHQRALVRANYNVERIAFCERDTPGIILSLYKHEDLEGVLRIFQEFSKFLTSYSIILILENKNINAVFQSLSLLRSFGILTRAITNQLIKIKNEDDLEVFARICIFLNKCGLLNDDLLNSLSKRESKIHSLHAALRTLDFLARADLLNKPLAASQLSRIVEFGRYDATIEQLDNLDCDEPGSITNQIKTHENPSDLIEITSILCGKSCLSKENFNLAVAAKDCENLINLLNLNLQGLDSDNISLLLTRSDFNDLYRCFNLEGAKPILTKEVIKAILLYNSHPIMLVKKLISILNTLNCLNPENLIRVLSHPYSGLIIAKLEDDCYKNPRQKLRQAEFEAILATAGDVLNPQRQADEPRVAIQGNRSLPAESQASLGNQEDAARSSPALIRPPQQALAQPEASLQDSNIDRQQAHKAESERIAHQEAIVWLIKIGAIVALLAYFLQDASKDSPPSFNP